MFTIWTIVFYWIWRFVIDYKVDIAASACVKFLPLDLHHTCLYYCFCPLVVVEPVLCFSVSPPEGEISTPLKCSHMFLNKEISYFHVEKRNIGIPLRRDEWTAITAAHLHGLMDEKRLSAGSGRWSRGGERTCLCSITCVFNEVWWDDPSFCRLQTLAQEGAACRVSKLRWS